jgi:NAD(P)H-hydrate epimerase
MSGTTLFTDLSAAAALLRERPAEAHKGTMGHAALIAGSYGMAGAAILSARACLRSGVGKLTCFTDAQVYPMMQVTVPEAVFRITDESRPIAGTSFSGFDAIGMGPGIGTDERHIQLLRRLFSEGIPLVLDADALNMMAMHPHLLREMPADSILTPHRKEFDRLFGENADLTEKAIACRSYIILKGHRTQIGTPGGTVYRNMSGNSGMATAGSGDVLTGILTGLRAQGYGPCDAARLGVFLHGLAGDIAILKTGMEALIASDLIDSIGPAFLQLRKASK